MERLDNIYESVLSEVFKIGDVVLADLSTKSQPNNWVKTKILKLNGNIATIDTAKHLSGAKTADIDIKHLKKESLSEVFKFTSPYDIQKFLKSNKNFAKEWSVEDMAAFTKQDVKYVKSLAQNALAQNLVNFNNGKYSDLKESLSEVFKFTSPYDIQKFLKSNKNFAKEWTVEDMAAFTKQDVKDIKRLAQNAYAQNLINFNNGKYSDLKESLSEDFKMGDIVSFIDPDWKKNYGNSKYEVGIVTSSGKIKLQDIKTKQRLPYTFEPTSLKKESLSSDSISESINTDLYNKFKKIDSNIIQSLRELREFVAKYYPRLVGNVRNVVDEYSDAVYDIEYNLSHSKESLSKLDNLYESVLKEGNGFLDYKGDWRGDNVKYLENDYKLWDNPQKYLPELKDFVKRIDYAISQNKDSPLIMASFEKSKKEADNLIKYFEDIIPITKQITKGKSIEDVKSILKKSKYWDWSDRDLMNNNAKVRGPMDLYIDFENDKVVKYNF